MRAQWQWIISGILLSVMGIFILTSPATVIKVAVIGFGLYTVLDCIYSLVISISLRKFALVFKINTVRILIGLAIGILVLYFGLATSGVQIASWTGYAIATYLLLSAITQFVEAYLMEKSGYTQNSGARSSAVISLILSVIMYIFPSLLGTAVITIIGVCMIFFSIVMIVWGIKMLAFEKNMTAQSREFEAEWENQDK